MMMQGIADDNDDFGISVSQVPSQAEKSSAYQELHANLLKIQLDDLGNRLAPDQETREHLEEIIKKDIKNIAKQSLLTGVDDEEWDVTRISWTGSEWQGFKEIPGYCYVEAFEHSNPPHDFIYLVSVRTGTPEFAASYEGDMDTFELVVSRLEASHLDLPDSVPRP